MFFIGVSLFKLFGKLSKSRFTEWYGKSVFSFVRPYSHSSHYLRIPILAENPQVLWWISRFPNLQIVYLPHCDLYSRYWKLIVRRSGATWWVAGLGTGKFYCCRNSGFDNPSSTGMLMTESLLLGKQLAHWLVSHRVSQSHPKHALFCIILHIISITMWWFLFWALLSWL